jgi:DNA-binding transcriptional LysR family regulator
MTSINHAHLARVDLNLLLAFDALYAERSVTRAARRVGVTQSAMSHLLRRLRELFDDELFCKGPQGMTPTPHAELLSGPVHKALAEVSAALSARPRFDPATAERKFVLVASDYIQFVLLPGLLARLVREAPGVRLQVRGMSDEVGAQLRSGAVDLLLGALPAEGALRQRRLFHEHFVCVLRAGHPLAREPLALTKEQYAGLRHILVSPQGSGPNWVDPVLAAEGLRRDIVISLPNYLVAPLLVQDSDLIVTLAARIATRLGQLLPLCTLTPPLAIPGFTVSAYWHERFDPDPAHAWLRGVIAELAASA